MKKNRYLALLAGHRSSDKKERQFYQTILNYLDDRNWPVKVWRHDKQNEFVKRYSFVANLHYGIMLCFMKRRTVVVDEAMLALVAGAILFARKIIGHDVIIFFQGDDRPQGFPRGWLWRKTMQAASLVVVSSERMRQQLGETGLDIRWIRIWPAAEALGLMHTTDYHSQDSIPFGSFFEQAVTSRQVPENLVEAIEQLDMKTSLHLSHQRRLN